MRQHLLFLLFFCMHCIARGQTGYDYRYWFDNDYSYMQEGRSLAGSWQFQADLSGLTESLHAIHIQVTDTAGVMSAPVTRFFMKMRDVDVKEGHYWFDNDLTTQRRSDVVQGVFDIDVTSLSEGFHTFHYQLTGTDGYYSQPVTRSFYRVLVPEASYYRCWVDEDYSTLTRGLFTGAPILVDITSISEGYHKLRVQLDGATPSSPVTHSFVKIPQTEGVDYLTCLCSVDDKQFRQEQVASTGGIINWNFDVSDLSQGFHRMQVQVVTPSGAATSTYDAFFLRTTLTKEMNDMKCVYCVDGAEFNTEAGRMSNGAFHCDLDVSALSDGLHRLSYYLTNDKGVSTKMSTQFFLKTPVGGNGIMQYQYWLNDRDDQKHTVTLDKRTNPFSLIKLLPVETQPIRSSNFQFAMKNGEPLIYARNEFHVCFYDTSGRLVEETKEYYDEQVSASVDPVGELQVTQTFPKLAENDIRWYTVQAAPGDTLAFRLSQAATMQVFAPSGEEVFRTSEDASVRWAGIHSWEDGTYYLAVHDVTGSQPNMTLDYMHMDKYDVVDWDVHTVGNGGCSTITFKGNGFRDLYAVDLYTAAGDSIHSVDVSHDSDAETAVTFDFTDAELGVYDAVFHFTEEDKAVSDVMTVEEAVDIELATNVTFPSTFLRGTSTTYTIKITNKGNMTAYAVPLDLRLRVPSVNEISKIIFGGSLKTIAIPTDVNTCDSIDEDVLAILYEEFEKANDISQFVFYRDSVENIDFGLSQVIIDIMPNTTETFTVTIFSNANSSSPVFLDAVVGKEWMPLALITNRTAKRALVRRKISREDLCCNRTKIECVADVVAKITGVFMPPGANCATSLALTGLETAFDVWCSDGNTAAEKFEKYLQSQGKSLASRLVQSAVSCVTFFFNNRLKSLREDRVMAAKLGSVSEVERITQEMNGVRQLMRNTIKSIYEGVMSMVVGKECIDAFTKPIPGCPPDPGGGGGSSTPVPPSDPNDIYGYLSGAGSKFIADSVAKVNYTIEFENDTAFAEASAHTIVIRDTLDSRYFDLKSFLPTSIKLGGREAFLDEADVTTQGGVTNFLTTIDVRPEINAIAQVEGTYSQQTGIAEWRFTSLDPMTMEPTDDLMQGILPVNYDGTSGIGEVMFEVGVKPGKADGTEIANRASIVFDYEEAILTPTWVNTVDAVAPMSRITEAEQVAGDSLLTLRWTGEDARSGIWYYDVYAQAGYGASWELVAEHVTGTECSVRIFEDIEYGFCIVATDMAGNRERKAMQNELMPENTVGVSVPDTESDGSSGELYDLSGRRTDARRTGVYIQGGRLWYFKR